MISFEEYVQIAETLRKRMKTTSEFRLAFQILDPERKGFITVKELRILMTTCGEPLTNEVHSLYCR